MTAIEWRYGLRVCDAYLLDIGDCDGFTVRIYVDDEVYDWGDVDHTDEDEQNLEVIGVGVRIHGDDDDLDSIWSVSFLDHDGHKAAAEAAEWYGFLGRARNEIAERARLAGFVETVA